MQSAQATTVVDQTEEILNLYHVGLSFEEMQRRSGWSIRDIQALVVANGLGIGSDRTYQKSCWLCQSDFIARTPGAKFCESCRTNRRREISRIWYSGRRGQARQYTDGPRVPDGCNSCYLCGLIIGPGYLAGDQVYGDGHCRFCEHELSSYTPVAARR